MTPSLSILMPSLNVVSYIDECLESVLAQTLSDIEIICIDAGSTDGTWEILKEYAKKDSRIVLIQSDRKSYGYQLNLGLQKAKGEYIGIVETDDYVSEEMYRKLYDLAVSENADLVKANYLAFVDLGQEKRYFEEREIYTKGKTSVLSDTSIWSGIYKRSFLLEKHILLHETPGAAFQDIGFVLQTLSLANKASYLQEPLYRYRTDRAESSTFSPKVMKFIYDEFQWLDSLVGENTKFRENLQIRMVNSLICEYAKALRAVDYNPEPLAEYLNWFLPRLKELLEQDDFWTPELAGYRKSVELIVEGKFPAYRRQADATEEKRRKALKRLAGEEKIIIFGAGARGRSYLRELLLEGGCVLALTDNDSSKWGSSLDCFGDEAGIPILSPQEAVRLAEKENAHFLIANKNHAEEIADQLKAMHVEKIRKELIE